MSIRLSDTQRTEKLDAAVAQFTRKGYKAIDVRQSTATMRKNKKWNWLVFIFGGIFTFGILWLVYPLYYLFSPKSETLQLNVDAVGNIKATKV